MPNTFGSTTTRCRLIDPRTIRPARDRFGRPLVPELMYANSLYVPGGRTPARGWLLLRRSDYDALAASRGLYATNLRLDLDECTTGGRSISLRNLAIVTAQCVTTGISADPNAVYLVEVTDRRGVLSAPWFQQGSNNYYNVRSPAYPGNYYTDSLSLGTVPWTWDGLAGQLWAQMGAMLGSPYPGLPSVPAGTPDGWNLPGVGIWDTLCDLLDHLGMAVAVDLTRASGQYTIVSTGANDAVFTAQQASFRGRLEDDAQPIDVGSGRVPGTVVVLFHRRNYEYGTEETVRRDSEQWATNGVYAVSVAAPAFFLGAQGTHFIWDDFSVQYDIDNNPLAADVVTAAAIAQERTQQYYDLVYSRTSGSMRQTYAGILPFVTGSQVDGVAWWQNLTGPTERLAWRTEVRRGMDPVFGECLR